MNGDVDIHQRAKPLVLHFCDALADPLSLFIGKKAFSMLSDNSDDRPLALHRQQRVLLTILANHFSRKAVAWLCKLYSIVGIVLQGDRLCKSRSASPLPDWLSQASTPAKALEVLVDSDDNAEASDEPAEITKADKDTKGEANAENKLAQNGGKANGIKRGRAVLDTSSDSEGHVAEQLARKRAKTAARFQKKAATPGKASKPGKLQQKGITAFLMKPEQSSAEPEEQSAALIKEPKPVQASQTPVRHQRHDLLLTSHCQ